MTLWPCSGCGTRYRLELFVCPRCRALGGTMPKITRWGGVSDVNQPAPEPEEESSPGTSSSPSSGKSEKSSSAPKDSDRSPAPTTASHSEKDHAEPASTARSTAGPRRTAKRKGD